MSKRNNKRRNMKLKISSWKRINRIYKSVSQRHSQS